MKKIAVIGATGMLGLPVVVALLELGFEVTALARDPEKARHMLPPMTRIYTNASATATTGSVSRNSGPIFTFTYN